MHISADVFGGRKSLDDHDDLGRKNRTTRYNDIIASFLPRHCFTSDFLSFIVLEHIWFFHRAIQLQIKSHLIKLNLYGANRISKMVQIAI